MAAGTPDERQRLNRLRVTAPDLPEEARHFYVCDVCGQSVDRRMLGDVLHHEQPAHEPLEPEPPVGFVPPMLPTLVESAPESDDWLHEIKHDGYRTQLVIDGGQVPAFTRIRLRRRRPRRGQKRSAY